VFPHLTSGNTNAPSYLVGEMASDALREEHKLSPSNNPLEPVPGAAATSFPFFAAVAAGVAAAVVAGKL